MKLIDDLRAEHDLIEQMAGALRAFAESRAHGEGEAPDGARFLRFFRLFAGDFHHAKEEDTLFPALQTLADLPERGPIAVLTADHRRMAGLLDRIEEIAGLDPMDAPSSDRLRALTTEYAHSLWHHIDAENSVLLPESEGRLLKKGVRELASREMTPAEASARAEADDLLRRYPPAPDTTIVRGDGCVSCRAFAENCRGLEREWWNEWEWEEFENHLSGD